MSKEWRDFNKSRKVARHPRVRFSRISRVVINKSVLTTSSYKVLSRRYSFRAARHSEIDPTRWRSVISRWISRPSGSSRYGGGRLSRAIPDFLANEIIWRSYVIALRRFIASREKKSRRYHIEGLSRRKLFSSEILIQFVRRWERERETGRTGRRSHVSKTQSCRETAENFRRRRIERRTLAILVSHFVIPRCMTKVIISILGIRAASQRLVEDRHDLIMTLATNKKNRFIHLRRIV